MMLKNPIKNHEKEMLSRRHRAERRFHFFGFSSVCVSFAFLAALLVVLMARAIPAFVEIRVGLDITPDMIRVVLDKFPPHARPAVDALSDRDYTQILRRSLTQVLGADHIKGRQEKRRLYALLSAGVGQSVRDAMKKRIDRDHHPLVDGAVDGEEDLSFLRHSKRFWVPLSADAEDVLKGSVDLDLPETRRRLKDDQLRWLRVLEDQDRISRRFNWTLFENGASNYPELSGIGVAAIGSLMMMMVVLALTLPLGVGSAIYLEKFAPDNRWTRFVEININNLAAVPSIIFGILGLSFFINFVGLPRSAPIVGGLVLTLMTLPVVIVAARAAIKAVPSSIHEAALSVGASHMQAVFYHVLPLAFPGIMTGTIIGLARALGETAPLLMIGMVAFVTEYPRSIFEPATALPVQVYMWAGAAERAFVARTAAAIIVLLVFLLLMNATAIYLRHKYERDI